MILSIVLFLFILGIFFGSFLNVLIYRLWNNQSILGRSFCDNCKRKLLWYDLIPLLSFILLSGKCRFCKKKISLQIPLVELVTGFLFAAYFLKVQTLDFAFLLNVLILSGLTVIFLSDANFEIIPDKILLPLLILALFLNSKFLLPHILIGGISFLIFFLIFYFSKGKAFGFGDVKFAGVLGVILGFPLTFVSFYISFLTGAIVSLILVLWRKKFLGDTIPFGPFLSLGAVLSIFLGDKMVLLLLNFLR